MCTDSHKLDYDQLAADYGRHRRLHPGVLRSLIERSGISAASAVLEVGCGTGNYLVSIRAAVGCRCVGVEPSTEMLARAEARGLDVELTVGSAEALPFAADSFELVFSVDVIHHVGDRPASFREARRVARAGGRLCVATDSEDDITRRRPLTSHFPETIPVELTRYPTIATLEREIGDAGFANIERVQVELEYDLTDARPYRDRAFSSLHLISEEAFAVGLARLEAEIARGPVRARSLYTLVWGARVSSDHSPAT